MVRGIYPSLHILSVLLCSAGTAKLSFFLLISQARRNRHAGHWWRIKDEIVSDVLLWTPAYGQSKVGRPARTYLQQLCDDTGCNPEDLSEAMNDRETWRERVRDIRDSRTTWWWWWWWVLSLPVHWVECLPMVRETWVQSQVASYQKL